jgi:hypothetical protein
MYAGRSIGSQGMRMTFPSAQELAKTLGTNVRGFHKVVKPQIVKDFASELRRFGARNPDIGLTDAGHIVFRHPKTGKTFITDVLMELYLP